jgi:hypothetical protein
MKNYYVFTTLLIISLSIAGTGAIAFVAIKPVAASDNNDEDANYILRIDSKSGIDKIIHFDSLDDCHDYVQHHSQLGLSFKDCIED